MLALDYDAHNNTGVVSNDYTLNRNGICFVSVGKPTTFKITFPVYHHVSAGTGKEHIVSFRQASLPRARAVSSIQRTDDLG